MVKNNDILLRKQNDVNKILKKRKDLLSAFTVKQLALSQFLNALDEIEPLVDNAINKTDKKNELFNKEITNLLVLQNYLVAKICKKWSLDYENILEKKAISLISKKSSELIKAGFIKNKKDCDKVFDLLILLEKTINKNDISNFIDTNNFSDDILVCIKCILMPETLCFFDKLNSLKISKKNILIILRWHNDLSTELAKDLAFNWDKDANFRDRESLFINSLMHCSKIVQDIWEEYFIQNISTEITSHDMDSILYLLKELKDNIIENDVGYLHCKKDLNETLRKVATYVLDSSNKFSKNTKFGNKHTFVQKFLIQLYIENSAKTWNEIATKYTNEILLKINKMTEKEKQIWSMNEGSEPMALLLFFSGLENCMNNVFDDKAIPDTEKLLRLAKSRLAIVWGLSDALCKIKKI